MRHVTDLLAARLGGELDAASAREVEAHLAACADCRAEAVRLQATWDLLAAAATPVKADVWSGVRRRTFAPADGGWFFGRSAAVRLSLAAATVLLGVLAGRWTGTLHTAGAADDDSDLAGVWLEDSSWHDQASGGLADSWLALADAGESRQAAGNGGSK